MATLATMTGAAGVITVKGHNFVCTHLSCGDIGQVQTWLKQRLPDPWEVAKDAMEAFADMPEAERDAIRKIIIPAAHADAKAGVVDLKSKEAATVLSTPEGMSLIVWLAVRRLQPNVTVDQMHQMMIDSSPEEHKAVLKEVMRIVKESIGAEGDSTAEQDTIVNPTTPPGEADVLPAVGFETEEMSLIGRSSTSSSSKTRKNSLRKFPK